jgi:hypothetical protein
LRPIFFGQWVSQAIHRFYIQLFSADEASGFAARNPVYPCAKRLRNLQRGQAAIDIDPNFLVQIEGPIPFRNDSPEIIKQPLFVTVHKPGERIRISRLRFGDPQHLFQPLELLILSATVAGFHSVYD